MKLHPLYESGYIAPLCSTIFLDTEADICTGTNTPGAGDYDDDNELDDLE